MELKHLKEVFGRARELTGHAHFVVIGSLSAIGAGLVSTREVRPRFAATSFLDAAEALRAREALDEDEKVARARGA